MDKSLYPPYTVINFSNAYMEVSNHSEIFFGNFYIGRPEGDEAADYQLLTGHRSCAEGT